MIREHIDMDKFIFPSVSNWQGQGMLLTSGDWQTGHFNTMTIGWGSIGVMWTMPFIQVVVRPVRFTYQFTEKYDTFTVCSFSKDFAPALELLGTTSGRDGDKIKKSGLQPIASSTISAPGFDQAELILECRKIYWQDMDESHFLDPRMQTKYPAKDYHRIYYGELLAIFGDRKFQK